MSFLYVCSFSNGHIKVGQSGVPQSRIAQHEERVACMGVTLVESRYFSASRDVGGSEALLIERCAQHADKRFKSEWFTGLDFQTVCEWAMEAATSVTEPQFTFNPDGTQDFAALVRRLMALGVTQAQMATVCRCSQPSISDLATGRIKEPVYSIGSALVRLMQERV